MNIKVACPHCQVVGVVPEELKYASDWLCSVSSLPSTLLCACCGLTSTLIPTNQAALFRLWARGLHLIKTSTNQLLKAIFHCFARIAMLTFLNRKTTLLSLIRDKSLIPMQNKL